MEQKVLEKLIGMFRACDRSFLNFPANEVIRGPNDRSLVGFDNYFPKQWLVEDYDFTEEEAVWLISKVQEQYANSGA